MRVSILVEETKEQDGVDSQMGYSSDNIVTVEDLLYVFGRASVASGFSYLTYMEAGTDDNQKFWTSF